MKTTRVAATAETRAARGRLLATLSTLRRRASVPELTEDLLALADPKLTVLQAVTRRVMRNKLLSLAVLAGAGWLAGTSRHLDGRPSAARKAGTATPRAKPKEKKNDSGQHQRNRRSGPGPGQRRKDARA